MCICELVHHFEFRGVGQSLEVIPDHFRWSATIPDSEAKSNTGYLGYIVMFKK